MNDRRNATAGEQPHDVKRVSDRRAAAADRQGVSRAPVFVVVAGLGLAVVLVFLGARIAATPVPAPDLSQPGTAAQPRDVNVIMRDYAFDPTPLHLVAGETVRFTVFNGGLVPHEFVLGDRRVQQTWAAAHAAATPPAAFASSPLASVPPEHAGLRILLPSGQSTSVVYRVPATGDLELFCHLPGHVEQGMVGEVSLAGR